MKSTLLVKIEELWDGWGDMSMTPDEWMALAKIDVTKDTPTGVVYEFHCQGMDTDLECMVLHRAGFANGGFRNDVALNIDGSNLAKFPLEHWSEWRREILAALRTALMSVIDDGPVVVVFDGVKPMAIISTTIPNAEKVAVAIAELVQEQEVK